MSGLNSNVGQSQTLINSIAKALASMAVAGALVFGTVMLVPTVTEAGGETRTLSMYHTHTKESLNITYMVNGRYVPSAMKKINYFLRDWRRNEVITIDPKTIDLMWELHADLGSNRPIHIISGYRSPKTNAFLKRIGRKVAKKSQHMKGKAIDFYFPDVPTAKIRNSALARKRVGGLGYYRSAGGPTGFLHADSGNVRNWGPGMKGASAIAYAQEGKKTVGKRFGRKAMIALAGTDTSETEGKKKKRGSILSYFTGGDKETETAEIKAPVAERDVPAIEEAYEEYDDELADLSEDAAEAEASQAATTARLKAEAEKLKAKAAALEAEEKAKAEALKAEQLAKAKQKNEQIAAESSAQLAALASSATVEEQAEAAAEAAEIKKGYPVPRPRLKPKAVFALAEAKRLEAAALNPDNVVIQPANAGPEPQTWAAKKPSPVADALGAVETAETLVETDSDYVAPSGNPDGKTSLVAEIRDGTATDVVIIKPAFASLDSGADLNFFQRLIYGSEEAARRDGVPPVLEEDIQSVLPAEAELGPDGTGPATEQRSAEGKGDSLIVNREGKTGLPPMKLRFSSLVDSGTAN